MAQAASADGHAAVETALTAATLQSASSVWLAQFPAEFDLSRLTDSKLKLRSAPNAAGELLSGKLPDGARISFVAEDPSLAAQLFVVAAPSSRAVQVQHRLTALVRGAEGDAEVPEDGAGGAALVTEEAVAAPVAAPEEERPRKKKRKDRDDEEPRKEKKAKKSRKDRG